MDPIAQFAKKQYLNLETFRKNGDGVKTPVWFAQEGESLYVMTIPTSGKAKRIRRLARRSSVVNRNHGTDRRPCHGSFR